MTSATLILGSPAWLGPAAVAAVAAIAVLLWSYVRSPGSPVVRSLAAALKATGIFLILLCLIEPLFSGRRPRPGANLFVVIADDSQSMQIHDPGARQSRSEELQGSFAEDAPWHARLSQDFDVRRYRFAERLQALDEIDEASLAGQGKTSSLVTALTTIAGRFQRQPLAGVLLLTDGNATDLPEEAVDWSQMPPIYPVEIGAAEAAPDVSVGSVTVTQTNFEQAPVTIKAEVTASGYDGKKLAVQLLNSEGEEVDRMVVETADGEPPRIVRFQVKPEKAGTSSYLLRTSEEAELEQFDSPDQSREATLANNTKWVTVDRPKGPYRVLYVSGRPNWEFKFLQRAVQADDEVQLVGLIRIAKREPKFSFLSRAGESTNPLYRGFESPDEEEAEQYDEPVLVRLGTRDATELQAGFPKTADELYPYDAIVLDDVEAAFFTQDQMLLLQKFVSTRGGGFLMLGGAESLFQGEFRRTPIGEMLPVYLDRKPFAPNDEGYRMALSREGWLQPWVRLRETEEAERRRLATMPAFHVLNQSGGLKPGATVLANVTRRDGQLRPALVAQRFGKGQVATLLIGDMWRWSLGRKENEQDDLAKAWRQTVRWLVSDVPGRVELAARRASNQSGGAVELTAHVRDEEYEPLDNGSVEFTVWSPDGTKVELRGEPSSEAAGVYMASYLPRKSGAYRVQASVNAPDGSTVGTQETGWTAEPAAEEFRRLTPDHQLLGQIAQATGGEVLSLDGLESFVASLPNRKIPITEPWIHPLWQKPWLFLLAVACLIAEWGLRRWKGLP